MILTCKMLQNTVFLKKSPFPFPSEGLATEPSCLVLDEPTSALDEAKTAPSAVTGPGSVDGDGALGQRGES